MGCLWGFGFNKSVITGILRQRLGFNGIVCTDWGLLSDMTFRGQNFFLEAKATTDNVFGTSHSDDLALL
jgi:beta-glucosidase-like glycosyl hydrolase